jgi:hypothetical protein
VLAEDFAAHAARVNVTFLRPHSPEGMKEMVSRLMTSITLDCVEAGTRLIGHVKCIAEIGPERYLACSVTTHDGKVRCTGALEKESQHLDLVINILQYGLEKTVLEAIIRERAPEAFADARVEVDDLDHGPCKPVVKPIQIQ